MPSKAKPEESVPGDGAVTTDSLAQDVADEKLEYPEGAPTLIPMLALPRMRRADAYDALGQITRWQREVRESQPDEDTEPPAEGEDEKPREIDPASYGAQYRVVAYVEEYLRSVAANEKVFNIWAAQVDDGDLIKTFNVYLKKTQPGEAESSAG